MDKHMLRKKPNDEREFQQLLVRENNQLSAEAPPKKKSVSRYTDYYFVGFEYPLIDKRKGIIDLVAIRCNTKSRRKNKTFGKLALVEVKFALSSAMGYAMYANRVLSVEDYLSLIDKL